MLTFANHAEAAGLASIWVCDHLLSGGAQMPPEDIHEAWTIISALAATTARVELGQLVMCASFRSPGLLAKMAVTADAVSTGRLILGVGAGWYDLEYDTFGFPTDHRGSRFDEYLGILAGLLSGERLTVDGRYHQVREAALMPAPDRHIPLLVAGHRPRMLRLTARHADAWNTAWYGAPNERLTERLATMDAALAAEGRDPAGLRRTVGMHICGPDVADPGGAFVGGVNDLARALDAYDTLGVDDLIVLLEPSTLAAVDQLAAAIALRAG
jgi:alkanesulfonate monooxygenase SsuD/methylene tetrahydromethanopterin reductase-like flavin-dependent oxidoreductase (luciferase family)